MPWWTLGSRSTCPRARGQTPEPGGNDLAPRYGQAGTVLGLPLAFALSFGEAF